MEEINDFNQYKVTVTKGIVGDMATEWWTDKEWAEHEAYITELKATGEYLKPVELTFNFMKLPEFDCPPIDFSKTTLFTPLGKNK